MSEAIPMTSEEIEALKVRIGFPGGWDRLVERGLIVVKEAEKECI